MSRRERSGWRDLALSERHRDWGFHCPAVDLDFVLVEYDQSEPVALIEYKQEGAPPVPPGSPSIVTIRRLADKAEIYAFIVRYGADLDWYLARALNYKAKTVVPEPEGKRMSEQEYMAFLHYLRGRTENAALADCKHGLKVQACKICDGTVRRLIQGSRELDSLR